MQKYLASGQMLLEEPPIMFFPLQQRQLVVLQLSRSHLLILESYMLTPEPGRAAPFLAVLLERETSSSSPAVFLVSAPKV